MPKTNGSVCIYAASSKACHPDYFESAMPWSAEARSFATL